MRKESVREQLFKDLLIRIKLEEDKKAFDFEVRFNELAQRLDALNNKTDIAQRQAR
ncbi:hypothetical protein [Bacillus pacificus]|uniref:hypothetical protein n=1 Tax=Bacillus pacificus TaxID=2026187 RepID=UPI00178C7F24|nr:hypothetical protein [Bacillus pacificus]